MRELRDATTEPKFDYFKRHLDLQMQAASAWIAYDEGRKEEAVDLFRRAAEAEDILGKHPVSPGALVPVREQLGDLLLELDRPQEAREEFEAALKIYPGRFRGLSGAAQSAERSQEQEGASPLLRQAGRTNGQADGPRSEVPRAHTFPRKILQRIRARLPTMAIRQRPRADVPLLNGRGSPAIAEQISLIALCRLQIGRACGSEGPKRLQLPTCPSRVLLSS